MNRCLVLATLCLGAVAFSASRSLRPGSRATAPIAAPAPELIQRLRGHVFTLAAGDGIRSARSPETLERMARYVEEQFRLAGYTPERRYFQVDHQWFWNIVVERPGHGGRWVIGAHYDSVPTSPGADDNASGVAVLLEMARAARTRNDGPTLEFVAFANEETTRRASDMGSWRHVQDLRRRHEHVDGMICLEMLGFYSDRKGSQSYPPVVRWFYPSKGNFVALVSNVPSRHLLSALRRPLRRLSTMSFSSAILPSFIGGIDRSDHMNFWEAGIPALMVTDTAFYRNPHYHQRTDHPATLNYTQMAVLTEALSNAVASLSRS
jgi:hypothetical protein